MKNFHQKIKETKWRKKKFFSCVKNEFENKCILPRNNKKRDEKELKLNNWKMKMRIHWIATGVIWNKKVENLDCVRCDQIWKKPEKIAFCLYGLLIDLCKCGGERVCCFWGTVELDFDNFNSIFRHWMRHLQSNFRLIFGKKFKFWPTLRNSSEEINFCWKFDLCKLKFLIKYLPKMYQHHNLIEKLKFQLKNQVQLISITAKGI